MSVSLNLATLLQDAARGARAAGAEDRARAVEAMGAACDGTLPVVMTLKDGRPKELYSLLPGIVGVVVDLDGDPGDAPATARVRRGRAEVYDEGRLATLLDDIAAQWGVTLVGDV